MKNKKRDFFIMVVILVIPFTVSIYTVSKIFPFHMEQENVWGIGIYSGDSPLTVHKTDTVANPVISASDVKDVKAMFVADPFMIKKDSVWYMYFEVYNTLTKQGDIGCASSIDGKKWEYRQIVIDEKYHLSYPFVFECNGQIYLIPESAEGNKLCLYRAIDFPYKWEIAKVLLSGTYGDHSLVNYNGTWWLFVGSEPSKHNTLRLFYSDDLFGDWREHPMSPVVKNNAHSARPGGRFLVIDGKLIRFAQDCDPTYGKELRGYEITVITKAEYQEKRIDKNPVLKNSREGWNRHGMHHMDAHLLSDGSWMACVDGYYRQMVIKVDY